MTRTICTLVWPEDPDYALIAGWLRPLGPTSALTGDSNEVVDAPAIRSANESGAVRYYMAVDDAGVRVGVVNYRSSGSAGGYSIAGAVGDPARWNGGVGADALAQLVDHLFHQLNAHRVEFTAASYNRQMMSMLVKGGFTLEGVLRDFHFVDGQYHDRTIWSILRHQFDAGAQAYAGSRPVADIIPAPDKQRARELFSQYLESNPPTSLSDFAERAAQPRPY